MLHGIIFGYVYLGDESQIPEYQEKLDNPILDSLRVCPRRLDLNLISETRKSGCTFNELNLSDYKRISIPIQIPERRTR